jgi:hypothetical protein
MIEARGGPLSDLRGATRIVFDATAAVVDVVEAMHGTIQRTPFVFGGAQHRRTRGITGFVYGCVRGVVGLTARAAGASLALARDRLPGGGTTPRREAAIAALNGVCGDYLQRTGNPLAIEAAFRIGGRRICIDAPVVSYVSPAGRGPSAKLLVLVHGLCMNDRQWGEGTDQGAALADALGYSPLHFHYNTGLHTYENGRRLASMLEALVSHWPVEVEDLCIVGHSMGGLVARSACAWGAQQGLAWLERLRALVFLGTPHHGAPLERGGHGLDALLSLVPYSAPLARLGRTRSAGIRDLRHGTVMPGHAPAALPAGVRCYAAAATLGARRTRLAERLVGDGLVPLDSALGRHRDRARTLRIPPARRWIGYEMGHLDLLQRPEVYAQLRKWLSDAGAVEG